MRTPGLALAWQLYARDRAVLAVLVACWLLFALLAAVLPAPARGPVAAFAGLFVLPSTLFYVLAVFAYGSDNMPIETRRSSFPPWQFTLPVSTAALVAWPMVCGTAAAALAWLVYAGAVLRPGEVDVPLVWPALLLAAALAWLQVILWSPFPLPLVRLPVAVGVPGGLLVFGLVGSTHGLSEPVLAVIFATLLPPAYLAAWAGVSRARHGEGAVWAPRPAASPAAARAPARRPFAWPARAQHWCEWRQYGLGFPLLLLGSYLPFTGMALLLARVGDVMVGVGTFAFLDPFTPETRVTVSVFHPLLQMPLLFAAMLGSGLGAVGPGGRTSPFLLTRPLTSAALVTTKLRLTALTTLAAAGVTLLTALAWLLLTGIGPDVAGWWRQVEGMPYTLPAWLLGLLALAGLLGLVGLQLGKGLVCGLSGNIWLRLASFLGVPLVLALAAVFGPWLVQHPEYHGVFRALLPWALGLAVLLKLTAVAVVGSVAVRRGLWERGSLAAVAGVWVVTAGCLLAVLYSLVPAGSVPWGTLPFGVVLVLPLARILAAPLALEWNRHR
jgi:hypothetical protein